MRWIFKVLLVVSLTVSALSSPAIAANDVPAPPFYAGWTADDWIRFRLWVDPAYRLQVAAFVIASYPSGLCGGDLPDCSIVQRESGFSLTARNSTSSASGKYQFLRGTWQRNSRPEVAAQFPEAWQAPEFYQDETARRLWDGGRGCGHWSC